MNQQHVLRLWSLLLVHLPGLLWKSLITLFGMLHLVYGTNSLLIFPSLVRHSLLHFHLSHMAVHHLHHHHLHFLLLIQSFILNLSLGSLTNSFLHRPFPFLPDWLHRLSDHSMFYSAQQLDLFAWCVRLNGLLVSCWMHLKSMHFYLLLWNFQFISMCVCVCVWCTIHIAEIKNLHCTVA